MPASRRICMAREGKRRGPCRLTWLVKLHHCILWQHREHAPTVNSSSFASMHWVDDHQEDVHSCTLAYILAKDPPNTETLIANGCRPPQYQMLGPARPRNRTLPAVPYFWCFFSCWYTTRTALLLSGCCQAHSNWRACTWVGKPYTTRAISQGRPLRPAAQQPKVAIQYIDLRSLRSSDAESDPDSIVGDNTWGTCMLRLGSAWAVCMQEHAAQRHCKRHQAAPLCTPCA